MQRNLLKGLCLLCPSNRAGHYIMLMWFLLFSSPILSGRRLDVYHTSTHDVALHHESKKVPPVSMAIILSVLDRFAKFFHCCKEH